MYQAPKLTCWSSLEKFPRDYALDPQRALAGRIPACSLREDIVQHINIQAPGALNIVLFWCCCFCTVSMIFILGVDLSLPCFSLIQDFFTGSFQQGILNTIDLFFPSEEKGVIFCHSWHTTSVLDLNSTILGVTATNYKFNLNNSNLNPWFVTGFSDGDSSFWVSIIPNKNLKIRWTRN